MFAEGSGSLFAATAVARVVAPHEESLAPTARVRRAVGSWGVRLLPVVLMLLQIVVVHEHLVREERVRPIAVPDTESYIKLSRATTLDGALTHYRTMGYPLLLRAFGWHDVVRWELWIFLCGVLALFGGVWAYSSRAWLALAAASPLLYGETFELLGRIQPDFVACGYVLLAVGSLLLLVIRPRNALLWAALVLTVVLAYQTRPATIFMIGWLPIIGATAKALHERALVAATIRWSVAIAAATILPYLAFASLRWVRVGHFGLVSFGGYNLSGLAACLLDRELVGELEPSHREIGRYVLRRREHRHWKPYRLGEGSIEWFEQYTQNIWPFTMQAAIVQVQREKRAAAARGEQLERHLRVAINDKLQGFSKAVIRRRPRQYLEWVWNANLYGWRQLAASPWVVWPGGLLALSVAGTAALRRSGAGAAAHFRAWPEVVALLLLGCTFFLSYLLLISLISFPFQRYYFGTVLLLPSALCVTLAAVGGELAYLLRSRLPARTHEG